MIIDLPSGRQTFGFDCGATALQIVLAYYGLDVREDELIKEMGCDADGTPVMSMIAAAEKRGFQILAKQGFTLDEIKKFVDEKRPVIVLVQAWAEKFMTLDEWKTDEDDGHYVIFIGYNDGVVVFEDPSSFRKTWMTEEEFLIRWHDRDPRSGQMLERYGIVLLGKEPETREIEHMD